MVTYTQRKTATFDDAIEDIYGKRVSFTHTAEVRYDHANREKDGGIYKKIFETERAASGLVIGCIKKYTGRLQINDDDPDTAATLVERKKEALFVEVRLNGFSRETVFVLINRIIVEV